MNTIIKLVELGSLVPWEPPSVSNDKTTLTLGRTLTAEDHYLRSKNSPWQPMLTTPNSHFPAISVTALAAWERQSHQYEANSL